MPSPFKSEAALAAVVRAALERDGWTVCGEVQIEGQDRRPDMVAQDYAHLDFIETKNHAPTFAALTQSAFWTPYCSRSWLAVPEPSFSEESEEGQVIIRTFKALGCGLMVVHRRGIRPVASAPLNPRPVSLGAFQNMPRSADSGTVEQHEAGSPGRPKSRELEAARLTLTEFVRAQPGRRLAHYRGMLQMSAGNVVAARVIEAARRGEVLGIVCPRSQIRRLFLAEGKAA